MIATNETKLLLRRLYKKDNYTIGKLYINDIYFCDTIEDRDRGLYQDTLLNVIKSVKVYGETAIPYGIYKVIITMSPKFKKNLPEVLNVPGFSGIRIHSGNTEKDSLGCIIVGKNTIKGRVTNSRHYMNLLLELLKEKENIILEITN